MNFRIRRELVEGEGVFTCEPFSLCVLLITDAWNRHKYMPLTPKNSYQLEKSSS